jgi:putative endonuclease
MTRRSGQHGETQAVAFLERHGYRVHHTNWHCRFGEIDIVARIDEQWVFVEVRSRRSGHADARASIGTHKQRRLIATAHEYLAQHNAADADWRIDAITICGTSIAHVPYAIGLT